MDAHQRYERMAVGHVLGGLDEVDAAAFRAHLLGCSDCRKRVNELRDIASDLATAEREERAAVRSAVEVEKRTDQDAPEAVDVAPARQWPWGVVVLALVPLLVLGTLAWAVWVRAESDMLQGVTTSQQQVLGVLATGEPIAWTSAETIRGDVATDGASVAVNLVGLPELRPDEGLIVWLLDASGEPVTRSRTYLPSQVAGGTLVAVLDQPSAAAEFVVSIENELPSARPSGYRVVSGAVPEARATTAG